MSEQANPYENAVAERVNGILKQEFMLNKTFPDILTARKAVKEAIRNYNEKDVYKRQVYEVSLGIPSSDKYDWGNKKIGHKISINNNLLFIYCF